MNIPQHDLQFSKNTNWTKKCYTTNNKIYWKLYWCVTRSTYLILLVYQLHLIMSMYVFLRTTSVFLELKRNTGLRHHWTRRCWDQSARRGGFSSLLYLSIFFSTFIFWLFLRFCVLCDCPSHLCQLLTWAVQIYLHSWGKLHKDIFILLQLESEATHRAITIANRVRRLLYSPLSKYQALYVMCNNEFILSMQARCPIYLVNVSSMSAGDMIASAKMQGGGRYNEMSHFDGGVQINETECCCLSHTFLTRQQAKWSMQRPRWRTPYWTGHSITTKTGLTPPPMSSYLLCGSTPTRPVT